MTTHPASDDGPAIAARTGRLTVDYALTLGRLSDSFCAATGNGYRCVRVRVNYQHVRGTLVRIGAWAPKRGAEWDDVTVTRDVPDTLRIDDGSLSGAVTLSSLLANCLVRSNRVRVTRKADVPADIRDALSAPLSY